MIGTAYHVRGYVQVGCQDSIGYIIHTLRGSLSAPAAGGAWRWLLQLHVGRDRLSFVTVIPVATRVLGAT